MGTRFWLINTIGDRTVAAPVCEATQDNADLVKVDLFVAKARAFDRSQRARRQRVLLSEEPERYAYVASAEDTVLAKLEWFRLGGGVADRQWRDVLGVFLVRGERLDLDYLRKMAAELGVSDLLEQVLLAARSEP
jgi:hypothetical protein